MTQNCHPQKWEVDALVVNLSFRFDLMLWNETVLEGNMLLGLDGLAKVVIS